MSYIVIDEDRCKGCELCTTVCPQGDLVQMADHFNAKGYRPSVYVDPEDECTGCTLCATMWLGRLEIFAGLLLFFPSAYRR